MLVQEIKPQNKEQLFLQLYKTSFPSVARFVAKMGGSLEDAKDVFQDALVAYYEKRRESDFIPTNGETAYLLGISRHLWYEKIREAPRNISLETVSEESLSHTEQSQISRELLHYLQESGKKCMELLTAFYYDKLNMKEIASKFKFSGERSATAQKFKCLEKVRNAVRDKSLNKEDFYE